MNRRTPATAFQALPKAQPDELKTVRDHRVRTDRVGKNGKVTLRWKGELRRLYIGRKYARGPVVLICLDGDVSAVDPETGTQWGHYTLDPSKLYHSNELGRKREGKSPPE